MITYKNIETDFKETGIASVCFLMRKYSINSHLATEYIQKLSKVADFIKYDKHKKIVNISNKKTA